MIPTKDELYQWYIIEDGAYKDAMNHFGITQWCFDTLCRKYGIKKDRHKTGKKSVQTRIAKAGSREQYNKQAKAIRDKNIIEKYGSLETFSDIKRKSNKKTWDNNHDDILNKVNIKKKENNSFNTSSTETNVYTYLLTKFNSDDIFREYSDPRYPYRRDFYVKSKDLFIELNLHWSHGGHLFDIDNEKDLQTLCIWKEKASISDFYANAIQTWTVRDINKYQCALKNKLNYLVVYSLSELYEVFDNE